MTPVNQVIPVAKVEVLPPSDLRRALQINAGWLRLLARKFEVDEHDTRATLRLNGEVISECSLAEALNMANEALEPIAETINAS